MNVFSYWSVRTVKNQNHFNSRYVSVHAVNFLLRYSKAASTKQWATSKVGSIEQLITTSNEQLNISIIKSRGWWGRRGRERCWLLAVACCWFLLYWRGVGVATGEEEDEEMLERRGGGFAAEEGADLLEVRSQRRRRWCVWIGGCFSPSLSPL